MSSPEPEERASEVVERASRAASEMDRLFAGGVAEHVPDEAARRLLALAVKLYAAKREAGMEPEAFPGEELTATNVVVAATDLLEAADVELFELGMWQVWGRP